ncbi:MFS transporter [Gryllotalpicola ginsengisoli]|uniref:MFS transporter n=1 Tax=Gryllotalpicola ginsengisoli TaxID=444608 RepID=UPI0003B3331A|nr:MFS transporter [Gryllotalpicola ginsengisoli]
MSVSATLEESNIAAANPRGRVILASLIGTSVEFYDFYAYATAAVLAFPTLFFPTGDPTTALLASFATFGAAMVARPIGAMFFGHFGDRIGRKGTLVASLLTMGIATFLIGLLPSYATVGWVATLMLIVLRLAQGFALGGEWSGAALIATENAPAGRRGWWGTFPQLGAPIGFIIANGVFLVINTVWPGSFLAWGWRVPFLFSAVMVIIGLWVRLRLVESETFRNAVKADVIAKLPLAAVLRRNWKGVVLGTFYMLATYVVFYLMTTFTLTYGTKLPTDAAAAAAEKAGTPFSASAYVPGLGIPYTHFVLMQILGVIFFGVFTLISGPIADTIGRKKLMVGVTVAIIVFGGTFDLFLLPHPDATFEGALVQAFLVIGFTLMGITFGPMGALLPELFPTNVRYTGSGVAYNISSILGAALAPIIAVALWSATDGDPWIVGVYLSVMGVLTLIALLIGRETKDVDFHNELA